MERYFTTAPPAADGFGTERTGRTEKHQNIAFAEVLIVERHISWQLARYASGSYWYGTWRQMQDDWAPLSCSV